MVHFTPSPGTGADSRSGEGLAPVTYLPGVRPARQRVSFARDERWAPDDESDSAIASVGGGPIEADGDPIEETSDGDKVAPNASSVSIRKLARRGMSSWELEKALTTHGIERDEAVAEVERLESLGFLDDQVLAENLVFTLHTRKGLGRSAIENELRRKHVADDIIAEALLEVADDDELERASELAVKRVGQLSSYDDETVKRRLNGFLARKGYSSSVIREALAVAMATRGRGGVRFR